MTRTIFAIFFTLAAIFAGGCSIYVLATGGPESFSWVVPFGVLPALVCFFIALFLFREDPTATQDWTDLSAAEVRPAPPESTVGPAADPPAVHRRSNWRTIWGIAFAVMAVFAGGCSLYFFAIGDWRSEIAWLEAIEVLAIGVLPAAISALVAWRLLRKP
jgi:hypothetical protein